MNAQVLKGSWNEIKGQIKERWGDLTDQDLQSFQGGVDQLVGLIQRKTGESRDAIEDYLERITNAGGSAAAEAGEAMRQSANRLSGMARQYGQRAADTLSGVSHDMADRLRDRYSDAEHMVQQNPTGSLAVVFGVGLLFGIFAGLMLRSR